MLHSPAHVSFWGIVCRSSPETGYATVCSHFLETPCRRLAFVSILHITDEPGLWPVSSVLRMETRESAHWLPVFSSKLRTLCYFSCIKGCVCVCAHVFEEEHLLGYCIPQASVISLGPYLTSKTSPRVVNTASIHTSQIRNLRLKERQGFARGHTSRKGQS